MEHLMMKYTSGTFPNYKNKLSQEDGEGALLQDSDTGTTGFPDSDTQAEPDPLIDLPRRQDTEIDPNKEVPEEEEYLPDPEEEEDDIIPEPTREIDDPYAPDELDEIIPDPGEEEIPTRREPRQDEGFL